MNSQKFRLLVVTVMIVTVVLHMPTTAQEPLPEGTLTRWLLTGAPTAEEVTETLSLSPFSCSTDYGRFGCSISGATTITLIGVDYDIGWYTPNLQGALAESWAFSENNTVLTIQLRDDLTWSDGVPITADDVVLSYELDIRDDVDVTWEGGARSPASKFQNVEALDDDTVQLTFANTSCAALSDVPTLSILPSHVYNILIEEVGYAGLLNHERVRFPDVVSGPFMFDSIDELGNVTLRRNDTYTDNDLGYVGLSELVFLNFDIDDLDTVKSLFSAGEISAVPVGREDLEFARSLGEEGIGQLYTSQSNNFIMMNLNQADPTNPQPAVDETGTRIEQGIHPIFGDKLVRQGFAHAIDYQRILDEVYFGDGQRLNAHSLPGSWAENQSLVPIPYDPDTALSLLAEAGWVPENPELPASTDNRLVCLDCLYAREIDADFNGSYLDFDLLAPLGDPITGAVAPIIAESLTDIGITVQIPELEWEIILNQLLGQTFDATLNGLNLAYPVNPTTDFIYSTQADTPGTGLNVTSFYNEAYFALESTAQTISGCGITERASIYHRMQEILQEEVPAIYLINGVNYTVVQNEIIGVDPRPIGIYWNIDTWRVAE